MKQNSALTEAGLIQALTFLQCAATELEIGQRELTTVAFRWANRSMVALKSRHPVLFDADGVLRKDWMTIGELDERMT